MKRAPNDLLDYGAKNGTFASLAGNILGRGYAAGIGMTIGGVFGRITGRDAAASAGTSKPRNGSTQRLPLCSKI